MPLWAAAGGAGPGAAGATTGVFMAATVASQLLVPALLRRLGHRAVLVLGAVALGAPALLLPLSAAPPALVGVAVIRGVGFGLVTVTGAALVADLVPATLRGRATGAYGVAVGLPQLVLLTGGVWAYAALGPTAVLVAGAALPLLAVPVSRLMPARPTAPGPSAAPGLSATPPPADPSAAPPPAGPSATSGTFAASPRVNVPFVPGGASSIAEPTVRPRPWWRSAPGPWLVMVVCAGSAGGVITVLPLAGGPGVGSVAVALFALTAAQLAGRAGAGEVVDRWWPPGRVTPIGLALTGIGAVLVAVGAAGGGGAVPVVVGSALVGLGFGAVQNDSLVDLFARAGPARSGPASTLWNTAYDSGTGVGATGLAVVLGAAGATGSFVVAALACLAVLPVALLGTRRTGAADLPRTASERDAPSITRPPWG